MTAWVIGGTSGIGAAISARLKDYGISVVATGREVDVTDWSDLYSKCMDIALHASEDNPLEQVFFCAGDTELEWLGMMGAIGTQNQFGILETNVGGFINLMDVLVHVWHSEDNIGIPGYQKPGIKRGLGVCAISSDAATRPMRTSIGYCASKAALDMAIRVAARELGPQGWKVFGVAPGMIEQVEEYPSEMTAYIDKRVPSIRGWLPRDAAHYEKQQAIVKEPMRIHPMTVADFAIDLALKFGPHLNGGIFTMNGGR
jgi:NAD(P)-dependent dehydrogenase (short-subunit alcohol dehydrogenase family)